MLVKQDSRHVLFEVRELDLSIDPEEQNCLTLVSDFDLIPIPQESQSVRCLSFLETILVLIVDDS